ncbi:ABC-type transport auxiliary lipoprotein family protein [Desulfolutivibrio sulfoxidireducens]|uniref:ABC-type transport auxiliary lipoprotein family protein n=1 Tax=Desulfolutivibrio sulfoxidireducens TaxID=2773299 RepID=UPI00159E6D28|nr:ABC-type transport auxiliary lipoprotein family protein [Desulfolutivibrio sulfoxidireducens]QLA16918.1 hypothetical protein GD605_12880 [Desulfolutivibrio sulfoxidireducens]QLA20484.1 hypothetical protein GD604_12595 [Desulfolutivibrio sulfoxidireducens]
MNIVSRPAVIAVLLALATLVAGCSAPKIPAPEKRFYAINPTRPETLPPAPGGPILRVRAFEISPAVSGKEMVYRLAEHEFESDYYNVYFVAPGPAVTQAARQWLRACGLFSLVPPEGSLAGGAADADLILEGSVTALYGDFRDRAAPKAVAEVQFFVGKKTGGAPEVVFQRNYRAAVPFSFDGSDSAALAAALNTALADVLSRFEADMRACLAGLTPAMP